MASVTRQPSEAVDSPNQRAVDEPSAPMLSSPLPPSNTPGDALTRLPIFPPTAFTSPEATKSRLAAPRQITSWLASNFPANKPGMSASLLHPLSQQQRSTTNVNFTLMDREVNVPGDALGGGPTLYQVCRSWVQNNPDPEPPSAPPAPPALSIPSPTPIPPALLEFRSRPIVFSDKSPYSDPEDALRKLKEHWVHVRHHHQALHLANCERFQERLSAHMMQSSVALGRHGVPPQQPQ